MISLNGFVIEPTIFPDNTSQVWKIPHNALIYTDNEITWEFDKEEELIHLAQLCHLLESRDINVTLYMPYFPYARQDKEVSNENTFAKLTFIRLLNSIPNIKKIISLDVHSNIGNHLMNLQNINPVAHISKCFETTKSTLLCFPDKGAKDRYSPVLKVMLENTPICSFTKDRDQETGYIKRLFLNELVDVKDQTVLIVDDLCDGGMTFKLTAERLYEIGAKDVHLYVSHGIFSKGLETLRESGINRIFTHQGEV